MFSLEKYIIDIATEGFSLIKKPKTYTPEELKKHVDSLICITRSEFSKHGVRISYDRYDYDDIITGESTSLEIGGIDLAKKHKFDRNDIDSLTKYTTIYGKIIDGINKNLPKDSAFKLDDDWDKTALYLSITRVKK